MPTASANTRGQRVNDWAWPGPADLYVLLLFAAAWAPILLLGRKSNFVMALATTSTVCAGLAYGAVRKEAGIWNRFVAWVVRIGAIAAGCWLFAATPSQYGRFIAVGVYAVLYVLCERAVWRRVHADTGPAA